MGEFILTFLLVVFVLVIGFKMGIDFMEDKAAHTSCAQFNPETSEFEWLEKTE